MKAFIIFVLVSLSFTSQAQAYKCTDKDGKKTYQATPCKTDVKQDMVIDGTKPSLEAQIDDLKRLHELEKKQLQEKIDKQQPVQNQYEQQRQEQINRATEILLKPVRMDVEMSEYIKQKQERAAAKRVLSALTGQKVVEEKKVVVIQQPAPTVENLPLKADMPDSLKAVSNKKIKTGIATPAYDSDLKKWCLRSLTDGTIVCKNHLW
jgi:hypothetical protein